MPYRVEIYDQTSKPGNDPTGRLAVLENAYNKKVEKELNRAGSFSFSLPMTDPKAQYLVERNHVKVFHDSDPVPVFDGRIAPWDYGMDEEGKQVANVTCEGFANVLMDNIWPGQVAFPSTTPADFYAAILARQSAVSLGTVEPVVSFYPQFSYDNLMFMAWKVPSIIGGDIEVDGMRRLNHWAEMGQDLGVRIEYGFNIKSIDVQTDPTNLVTRLYGLGSAEGVNQVTIKPINGGIEYLDADTQSKYGIIESVYTDKQVTDPGTLMLAMQQVLEVNKEPYKTFSISAAYLAELTGYEHTAFGLGDWLIIRHVDLGIETKMRVIKIDQDWDYPENITLEFGSRARDLSDLMNNIKSKQNTWEQYPQGAPNLYVAMKEENVDPTHPLTLRFPIPTQVLKTTRVLLSLRGIPLQYFSQVAGASSKTTTDSGGSTTQTSAAGGDHSHLMFSVNSAFVSDAPYGVQLIAADSSLKLEGITCSDNSADFYTKGSSGSHSHNVSIPNHSHGMDHTHTQSLDIFDGTYPKLITLKVDGVDQTAALPARGDGSGQITIDELDITQYLAAGTYVHTIEIGSSQLGRIDCWVIPQVYIQSA